MFFPRKDHHTIHRKAHARSGTGYVLGTMALAAALPVDAGTDAAPVDTARVEAARVDTAQFDARPVTEIPVREGPGTRFPTIGVIDPHMTTDVLGCIDASRWCEVVFGERTGWVNADYLLPETRRVRVASLPATVPGMR